jgi:hypothetical protein
MVSSNCDLQAFHVDLAADHVGKLVCTCALLGHLATPNREQPPDKCRLKPLNDSSRNMVDSAQRLKPVKLHP